MNAHLRVTPRRFASEDTLPPAASREAPAFLALRRH